MTTLNDVQWTADPNAKKPIALLIQSLPPTTSYPNPVRLQNAFSRVKGHPTEKEGGNTNVKLEKSYTSIRMWQLAKIV